MVHRLDDRYRAYIACLNRKDWIGLTDHVADDVRYNDELVGLTGYRNMLVADHDAIPDLSFDIELLMYDDTHVASRLRFDCTPKATFLGLDVNGRRISFTENVFYRFDGDRIKAVWSIIDKAAIEAQLEQA